MTFSPFVRAAFACAGVFVFSFAPTWGDEKPTDKTKDKPVDKAPKLPPLDSSEWKEMKDGEGLKMWDVKVGTGSEVKEGATVTIHYTGWLTNGKKFDSSLDGDEPATFPLGSLIKGWQKGIPGMKEGGVRRLLIPSALGYGERGAPPDIPGGSTLVFEIELIADRSKPAPSADAKEWKDLPGVDGMKIWDVKEGSGDACKEGATVSIHYTGWLTDGTKFDSSFDRGRPADFPLKNLIKGWQLAVPGMKPGGVRRMLIPYQYAYGESGKPPKIPAKATLIFEVEYIKSLK